MTRLRHQLEPEPAPQIVSEDDAEFRLKWLGRWLWFAPGSGMTHTEIRQLIDLADEPLMASEGVARMEQALRARGLLERAEAFLASLSSDREVVTYGVTVALR